jgi:hypothetical protein
MTPSELSFLIWLHKEYNSEYNQLLQIWVKDCTQSMLQIGYDHFPQRLVQWRLSDGDSTV